MSFTKEFRYLGSLVHHSLTSGADLNKRVKSAAAAFGSLRSVLCNFALSEPLRCAVYSSLVLIALLYGSEVWCLSESLFAKFRIFHSWCCHAICRITITHTIHHTSHRSSCVNIEAHCAAPPEALAHSPSQMPLSCPVAPQAARS